MKLRHIYITKEGEPMANPEMEYPTLYFISGGHEVARTDLDEALAKYHSGLLPFEDGHLVDVHLWMNDQFEDYQRSKPDTLIPVDLEVEVVDVFTKEEMLKIAQGDGFGHSTKYVPSKNRVLRIKN